MLDFMRKKTNSLFVYVILGGIIGAFVLGFGPASNKAGGGCSDSTEFAKIGGMKISQIDWKYGRGASRFIFNSKVRVEQLRYTVDKLIERKILSNKARNNGIKFTKKDVENMILRNRVILFGMKVQLSNIGGFPSNTKTREPLEFNYKVFERMCRSYFGMNVDKFLEQQIEEMEALTFKNTFIFGFSNSNKGDWVTFQNTNLELTFKAAKFFPFSNMDKVSIKAKDVKAFMATEKGKKAYELEFKKNRSKYSKRAVERDVKVLTLKFDGLYDEVSKQEKKDLDSLEKNLTKFNDLIIKIKKAKKALTIENIEQAAKATEKQGGKLVNLGWVKEIKNDVEDPLLDPIKDPPFKDEAHKKINEAIFKGKVGSIHGPVFIKSGVAFIAILEKRGGDLSKEDGMFAAAELLLKTKEAEKYTLKIANDVLAKLKKGDLIETLTELPEMVTEGPINPLKGKSMVISRELATKLWKLKKPGDVLPTVITSKSNPKSYSIYILESKYLPSKEEFEKIKKDEQQSLLSPNAFSSYRKMIKKECTSILNSLSFAEKNILGSLNFKRPKKLKDDSPLKNVSETYSPCSYVGR
jgi:SurA-like N-terminal domain